jgi:hypothetical protein
VAYFDLEVMVAKVRVKLERKVITYADFWRTSEVLLERAQAEPGGSYYFFLGSLVFSAFSLEAFLNHMGESLFDSWSDLEILAPRGKLIVICEHLGLKPKWNVQPWQTVPELAGFRNKIAHGKNALVRFEKTVSRDKYEKLWKMFLFADWQKYASETNAVRVRKQLEALFRLIHEKANLEDDCLFNHGAQVGSGTLAEE